MQTLADEYRDKSLSCVIKSIENLHLVLVQKCSGSEEFTTTYKDKLEMAYSQLHEVRRLIDRDNL